MRSGPDASHAVIQITDLHKVYAAGEISVHALRGVSLTIMPGDYVAIMGASGSGKSTLMNILGCLDAPTRGEYYLDGVDVRLFSEDELADVRNRKIGFIFQSFNLVPRTSAISNVELPLAYGGLPRSDRRPRAEAALNRVGMANRARHLPSEMSGGQQQRTAVARAIATNPALILADEPTGNLDTKSTADVLSVFDQLNRVEGRTVVLITHEDDVADHAKRVIRLSDGVIVSDERERDHRHGARHQALGASTRTAHRGDIEPVSVAVAATGLAAANAAPVGLERPVPAPTAAVGGRTAARGSAAPPKPPRAKASLAGLESVRIGMQGLLANKMRTALTMLGLLIGVASVIILISVGTGSSQAVSKSIESLGTNVLLVMKGFTRGGAGATQGTASLTLASAQAIENKANNPDVESVSPVINVEDATLAYDGASYEPSTFVGTTPPYETAHDYHIASGTFFTNAQEQSHARVLVVGQTVVTELFNGADPVGDTVTVNGTQFQVIGVLQPKGSDGAEDQDDVAMAPLTAVEDTLSGFNGISSITVEAKSSSALNNAEAEVTASLENQLGTTAADPGFEVLNQGSLLSTTAATSNVFTTLLGAVAAISLLVAGIGVMNIMLVSVTERTREIGIRKAIGARKSDILSQFLVEAVLVSMAGGLLGVILGVIGSQFEIAGVQPVIATYSLGLAFGVAVAIGLFFGSYPASRAASLRPIEALRYE